MEGIQNGFHIIKPETQLKATRVRNHKSALKPDIKPKVEKLILKEVKKGNYKFLDRKPTIVSAIGVVPKGGGEYRLIHDCSLPEGDSLNSYSPEYEKYTYESVDSAVNLIKPGYFVAKIDIKSAYRHIPIHPRSQEATGLEWTFADGTTRYMYDVKLPFGARASPTHFHRISQSIKRMMERRGYNVVAYQDDFLCVAETYDTCLDAWVTMIELLLQLGLEVNRDKLVAPCTCLVFLGIQIDTVQCNLALPEDKLQDICALLDAFLKMRRATKRQFMSLAGKLNFAARVVRGARTFLRRLLNCIAKLKQPHHKARVQGAVRQDILWWQKFMRQFNGIASFIEDNPLSTVMTDSCNAGAGAFFEGDFWYVNWHMDFPELANMHINYKEAAIAALSILKWGHLFRNRTIYIYTDNTFTSAIINKCACRNNKLMQLLRRMFWISAKYNFVVRSKYIKGVNNNMADCISRLHEPGRLLELEAHINTWYMCHHSAAVVFETMSLCNHMSLKTLCTICEQVTNWQRLRQRWTRT